MKTFILSASVLALAAIALLTGFDNSQPAFGQPAAAGNAQLGSPQFVPTTEHPVGWRGDGSGRFPAATPPTTWARTIKGPYHELRCQAGKPKGDTAAGEVLNMGYLRDWLIVGPFTTDDFKAGIDQESLKDEATLAPKEGDKAGDVQWTHYVVSVGNQSQSNSKLQVDLALNYGKQAQQEWQNHPGTMEPWLAYAQTALWSPQDTKVRLRVEGAGAKKIWLNGAPVAAAPQYQPGPVVDLKKGWNNLVVKCLASKGAWNFYAMVTPVPPYEYETKNIVYMTPMPGPSWCSPIIVGDKMFVSADAGTLVCMNKADGKVLWMRSTTYLHAITADERAKFADLVPQMTKLDAACDALPAILNENISPDGAKADRNEAMHKAIKEKMDLENGIQAAMAKADKLYNSWGNDADTSKYVPTSDGKHVWVVLAGGNKGIGANVVACFDLDGKRLWSFFTGQTNISEHGTHSSPAICGEYLVVKSGAELFGFEKLTGKVAWQTKIGGGLGASIIPVRIGKDMLAYVPQYGIVKPSDGSLLWKATIKSDTPTPVVVDGAIYGVGENTLFGFKLPDAAGDNMNLTQIMKAPAKDTLLHMPGTFTDSIIGSPLVDNGYMYIVSEGGGLTVVDIATGKKAYDQKLESLNPRLTWVFVVGICSSATSGGKYIYIRDDGGQTLVIEPGPKYKEVAKNLLVELSKDGVQPESQSNFYFEGSRIYFRTRGFMYCIGEK